MEDFVINAASLEPLSIYVSGNQIVLQVHPRNYCIIAH